MANFRCSGRLSAPLTMTLEPMLPVPCQALPPMLSAMHCSRHPIHAPLGLVALRFVASVLAMPGRHLLSAGIAVPAAHFVASWVCWRCGRAGLWLTRVRCLRLCGLRLSRRVGAAPSPRLSLRGKSVLTLCWFGRAARAAQLHVRRQWRLVPLRGRDGTCLTTSLTPDRW